MSLEMAAFWFEHRMNDSGKNAFARALENYQQQQYAEAEKLCHPLAANPQTTARACLLLGLILGKTERLPEAVQWFARAAELDPAAPEIWSEWGRASNALQDYIRAADCFARFIALRPDNADGYFCLANAYQQAGRYEEAVAMYRQAVERDAGDAASWNNLGKAFSELNQLPEALAAYDRAQALQPDSALTRRNRGIALLKSGRWLEGWPEYEWRRSIATPRLYAQPKWNGEMLPGKTLFIHAEQGLGDSIQFVRFVSQARARVGRMVLECQAPLKRLFKHGNFADEVVAMGSEPPSFNAYVALASLPGIFGVTPENLADGQYLSAPPCDDFSDVDEGRLNVGIVWAGNAVYGRDAERSIPIAQFKELLQVGNVAFFSFQKTLPAGAELAAGEMVSLADRMGDFYDTAALVGAMDLVISADTAMAHLAGALGKPVWTLLPFAADWRWLLERSDTPWYRSMRLFRQERRGDWAGVLGEVRAELSRLAAGR